MKHKTGEKLVPWCRNIIDDEAEHIKRFARGVLNDYQSVYQGFESNRSKWACRRSSQQTQNN